MRDLKTREIEAGVQNSETRKFVNLRSGKFLEIQIMENQNYRNVRMEHELVVDGVNLRECKELIQVVDDESGQPKQILIHSRSIGDNKYVVKQVKVAEEIIEETVDTNMNDTELEKFNQDWIDQWQPSIGQQSGFLVSIGNFFRRANSFPKNE